MTRIIIAAALLFASPAWAQQAPCGQRDTIIRNLMGNHGEFRQFFATTDQGRSLIEMYANPETGTWTALKSIVGRPDMACMLGAGEGWTRDGVTKPGEDS